MTKAFERRLFAEGSVFTRKYCYVLNWFIDHMEIQRLPIEDLDTTRAIDGWETVKRYD